MTSVIPGPIATAEGLADTSLFIALGKGRPLAVPPPTRLLVSVITIAELRFGVLAADGATERASRLDTLQQAESLDFLPADTAVAAAWAALRTELRAQRVRLPVNDTWIAATAIAHGLPVVTQDADYDGVPGLDVIRV